MRYKGNISFEPVNMIYERYLRTHFTVYLGRGNGIHTVAVTTPNGKLLEWKQFREPEIYFVIMEFLSRGYIFDGYKT